MTHNMFLKGMGATPPAETKQKGRLPSRAETRLYMFTVDPENTIACVQCGNTRAQLKGDNTFLHQHVFTRVLGH